LLKELDKGGLEFIRKDCDKRVARIEQTEALDQDQSEEFEDDD